MEIYELAFGVFRVIPLSIMKLIYDYILEIKVVPRHIRPYDEYVFYFGR